ncbi:MAG: hypothetical protein R3E50_12980 [Halioglobus sp.]
MQGRTVILAGTNNYLGLSFDPRCIKAAQDAAGRWGTGTTGSRLANGSLPSIGRWKRRSQRYVDHAIVFSTGYSATMGMRTLAGPGDGSCGRRQPRQHLLRGQAERRGGDPLQTQQS